MWNVIKILSGLIVANSDYLTKNNSNNSVKGNDWECLSKCTFESEPPIESIKPKIKVLIIQIDHIQMILIN